MSAIRFFKQHRIRHGGAAEFATAQDEDGILRHRIRSGILETAPALLSGNRTAAVGKLALIHAGDFLLVALGVRIAVQIENVARILCMRRPCRP